MKHYPLFAGHPSPSLRKMQQMTSDELPEHLARMEQERDRIAAKLEARRIANVITEHDHCAAKLEKRLGELISEGRQMMVPAHGYRRCA